MNTAINPTANLTTAASILNALETVKGIAAILEQQAAEAAAREEAERKEAIYAQQRRESIHYLIYTYDMFVVTEIQEYQDGEKLYRMKITCNDMEAMFSADHVFTKPTWENFTYFASSHGRTYGLSDWKNKNPENGFEHRGGKRFSKSCMEWDLVELDEFLNRCWKISAMFADQKFGYLIPAEESIQYGRR